MSRQASFDFGVGDSPGKSLPSVEKALDSSVAAVSARDSAEITNIEPASGSDSGMSPLASPTSGVSGSVDSGVSPRTSIVSKKLDVHLEESLESHETGQLETGIDIDASHVTEAGHAEAGPAEAIHAAEYAETGHVACADEDTHESDRSESETPVVSVVSDSSNPAVGPPNLNPLAVSSEAVPKHARTLSGFSPIRINSGSTAFSGKRAPSNARRYSRIIPIEISQSQDPAPSASSSSTTNVASSATSVATPSAAPSAAAPEEEKSLLGTIKDKAFPPKKRSLGWFKPYGNNGGSPTRSTESLPVMRDFIMRRIQATRESQQGARAEESQSGIRELQQNFAEMTRASTRYNNIDWEFWTQVVQDYAQVAREQPARLKRAIQSGFPPELRGLLWQLIAASKSAALEQVYSSLVAEESPCDRAIDKDIDRTSMVKQVNTDGLTRVLKAYSLFDPEVGYTQGMAFVAVPLLLDLSEYEAFCLFVQLMKGYDLRSLFLPEMPGLHLRLYQFDRLIEDRLETVHVHLKRQGVLPSMYASQWFLTLFAYKFPVGLVQRIFDIVIAEGYEAVLRFGLALMQTNAARILELEFDELLPFLKDNIFDFYVERPNELVKEASAVELTPNNLAKYEHEHQEIHRYERERTEQMDSLRTANTKLTFQVRQLESSLGDLNQEHVDIANKMVATGLENARLLHENEEMQRELKYLREAVSSQPQVPDLLKEKDQLLEVRQRLEAQINGLQEALAATMEAA